MKSALTAVAAALLVLAVAVAARGGAFSPASAATPAPANATYGATKGLVTSGQASVKVKPDLVILTVGVTIQAPTATDAQTQVNDRIARVVARAKALGIADRDVAHGGYSINPVYPQGSYNNPPAKPSGYSVSQQLTITYRDVNNTGKAVDNLVQDDGAMQVQVRFGLDDPKGARETARGQAIADARVKAQAMAAAAGSHLGRVVGITDGCCTPSPIVGGGIFAAADTRTPTNIPVADLDVSLSVQVTWELLS